jgi:hypothetical protein
MSKFIDLKDSTMSADILSESLTIDLGSTGQLDYGNLTVSGWNGSYYGTGSLGVTGSSYTFQTNATGTNKFNTVDYGKVNIGSDGIQMDNETDIKIGSRSLKTFMEKVEQRLAILQPDPELLDKFEALKQAYEHYKTLEALCMGDIPKDPNGR